MGKKVVDAMKDLCKDVNFDCSEKGVQVQSMDSSHVALVSLMLRESAFSEFKCDRPMSLGMNVDSLGKILKMCSPNDSIKVQWRNDADSVNFQCESGEDDRIADFDLKLMQIESEHMEIPEQQYKVVVKMPSSEFLKVCRDLKEFGETMQIQASKDGIRFSVQGDVGTGNVVLKPRESEKPEERVSLTVHEAITATFALRYLVTFSKAAPLSAPWSWVWDLIHHCPSSTHSRMLTMAICSSTWRPRSTSEPEFFCIALGNPMAWCSGSASGPLGC